MNGFKTALLACVMTPLGALSMPASTLAADGASPMLIAQIAPGECPPGDKACLKAQAGKAQPNAQRQPETPQGEMPVKPQKPKGPPAAEAKPGVPMGGEMPTRPQKPNLPPSVETQPGVPMGGEMPTKQRKPNLPPATEVQPGAPQGEMPTKQRKPNLPPSVETQPGAPQGEMPAKPQKPNLPPSAETQPGAPQGEMPAKPQKPNLPPSAEVQPGAPQGEMPAKPQKPNLPPSVETQPGAPQGEMPAKPQKPNLPPSVETQPGAPMGEMPAKPQKPNLPPSVETQPGVPMGGDMPTKPQKPNLPPSTEVQPGAPQGEMPARPQKPNLPPATEVQPGVPQGGMSAMPQMPQRNPALDAAIRDSGNQRANSIAEVQRDRRTIRESDGSEIVVEPGGRVIIQNGDTAIIRHSDADRLDLNARNVEATPTADGGRSVVVYRPDGVRIRTVYDRWGGVVQRVREDPDGRSYILFDNRMPPRPGFDGPSGPYDPVVLPPPVYTIPQERVRVDLRTAPPAYVVDALTAPPIVPVEPRYTLNQVIYSPDLRARVRSVDLDTITFDTGSWTVDQSQAQALDTVANGIRQALTGNANEVFLIEGYTDAVGSAVDNLSLSDRRAEAVAGLLTQYYQIPPENLVTQGYGESQLKVQTQDAERANRRVVVRRITPLLQTSAAQ